MEMFEWGPIRNTRILEERFLALGEDPSGRFVIVAFTFRTRAGARLIRPISARYMHAKEVRKYEQAFTENKE